MILEFVTKCTNNVNIATITNTVKKEIIIKKISFSIHLKFFTIVNTRFSKQ